MPNTMTLISAQTIGSGGAANFTFSSIPQTYTDLHIYASMRVTGAGEGSNPPISRGEMTFNGTGSNYANVMLYGLPNQSPSFNSANGAGSPGSRNFYSGAAASTSATANTFSAFDIYINDYTSSNYKTYNINSVIETNSSSAELDILSGTWNNTAAITSIKLNPYDLGNFAEHSTMYLYGISKS